MQGLVLQLKEVLGRDGIHELALFKKLLNINVTGTLIYLRLPLSSFAQYELEVGEERAWV